MWKTIAITHHVILIAPSVLSSSSILVIRPYIRSSAGKINYNGKIPIPQFNIKFVFSLISTIF